MDSVTENHVIKYLSDSESTPSIPSSYANACIVSGYFSGNTDSYGFVKARALDAKYKVACGVTGGCFSSSNDVAKIAKATNVRSDNGYIVAEVIRTDSGAALQNNPVRFNWIAVIVPA